MNFDSEGRCLSLQCSPAATYFSPHKCVESLDRVCENMSKFHSMTLCRLTGQLRCELKLTAN